MKVPSRSLPPPPLLSGGVPFLGHTVEFLEDRLNLLRRGRGELGELFSLKLGSRQVAVVVGPEPDEDDAATADGPSPFRKPYRPLGAMFGEVGFGIPNELFREQGALLLDPFGENRVPGAVEVLEEETRGWIESLADEGEMELSSVVEELVRKIAGHALMGREFQEAVGSRFWELYEELCPSADLLLPTHFPTSQARDRVRAARKMKELLEPLLAERRSRPESRNDLLQGFVNLVDSGGNPLRDEVVIGLILSLLFSAHEFAGSLAAWTVIRLLQQPDDREQVEAELLARLSPGTSFSVADLGPCRRLRWAIRETERRNPAADLLLRRADEPVRIGDYLVPEGWLVAVVPEPVRLLLESGPDGDPGGPRPGRRMGGALRSVPAPSGEHVGESTGGAFARDEVALVTAQLLWHFELELLTGNPGTRRGVGANRPAETGIRYRRRSPEEIRRRVERASGNAVRGVTECLHVGEWGAASAGLAAG